MFLDSSSRPRISIKDASVNITDGVHNTVKNDPNGAFYLLSCKNIKNRSLIIGEAERKINEATFNKLRKRTQLKEGDILLTSVGTIGEILYLKENPINFEFQRSVAMIKPNINLVSPSYMYEALLTQKEAIMLAAHGAVQQCLFISDIEKLTIPYPSPDEVHKFNNATKAIFRKILMLEKENAHLVQLRNLLIPKLLLS